MNSLLGICTLIGALAYAIFDINPFYFIFAVPFLYPFFDELSSKA
ncbi:hypothetical protein [Campylobacter californiensis]|nr:MULTISPECIES: hypothetical protein [unclassified Campylobacter]